MCQLHAGMPGCRWGPGLGPREALEGFVEAEPSGVVEAEAFRVSRRVDQPGRIPNIPSLREASAWEGLVYNTLGDCDGCEHRKHALGFRGSPNPAGALPGLWAQQVALGHSPLVSSSMGRGGGVCLGCRVRFWSVRAPVWLHLRRHTPRCCRWRLGDLGPPQSHASQPCGSAAVPSWTPTFSQAQPGLFVDT